MNIRYLLPLLCMLFLVGCKDDDDRVWLYKSVFTLEAEGGTVEFSAEAAQELNPVYPEWITLKEHIFNNGHHLFKFEVTKYYSKTGRSGEICLNGSGTMVRVVQNGLRTYVADKDKTGLADMADKQLKIKSAWSKHGSNSEGPDEHVKGTEPIYDGVKSDSKLFVTPWNAKWAGYGTVDERKDDFPHELKLFLSGEDEQIDYMIFYPRVSYRNGRVGVIDIYVSTAEKPEEFILVKEKYDCVENDNKVKTIYFNQSVKHPHTVKILIHTVTEKDMYVAFQEIELYGKSSQVFDTSTLFADELCSKLKNDITLEEIEGCPYPFFRNIALYMYYDCYETDYRIAKFKAWRHPDKDAAQNKTTQYSLLDNPTGISVEANEQMVIMVGDMYDQELSLILVDFDTPGKDGFSARKTYPLRPGTNVIKMEQKGLLYVAYHTEDYATVQPVEMHFTAGKVNGYFDTQRENCTMENWNKLLANASVGCLDVLGTYAHIIFPVQNLKQVENPVEWVKFYDDLVYNEQVLLGLVKYDKMFKNRMLFSVMYNDSYMYSTIYHTGYSEGTINALCNLSQLKADSWGPSHEVGHSNQTRPGLKWTGMTEVTNNIHSMYMQRINSGDSRLWLKGYYPNAMTTAFTGTPHIKVGKVDGKGSEDVFCQLVPFWQLQLYMAYVLGKEEFYPDVYEYIRNNTVTGKQAWEYQVEFPYICSKISGMDLTEFFEKWGFLRKVNTEITDYGVKGIFKIGDAELAAAKERIAGLDLPKPAHAFWYITEKNEHIFKENLSMGTSGNATLDRETKLISVSGFNNAVAFEVYDKDASKLVYVAAEAAFSMNLAVLPTNIEVRAVSATGESKVVPLN